MDDVPILLHELTFVPEGEDEIVIGRADIDSFAVFPLDAAAVVRRLQGGHTVPEVSHWYLTTYGEPADIPDLVETLRELRFVRDPADEDHDAPDGRVPSGGPVRWQALGRALFSWPAWLLYAALVAGAVLLAAGTPQLRPSPGKVFFSSSLVVIELVVFAGQLLGVAWHEGFHVLAGRRLGLPSRLSIGRRLSFVVFETTLVGLMGVPRGKRVLPFCAGLVADALFAAGLVCAAALDRTAGGAVGPFGRVACGLAYLTLLRMAWQFLAYMETDLYYVVATVLRCPDLHRLAREQLRSRFWRAVGRPQRAPDSSGVTDRDLRLARRYAPVVVLGGALTLGLVLLGVVPVLLGFAARLAHALGTGRTDDPHLWDSAFAASAILAQLALLVGVTVRDRRRRARTAPTAA
ncbi:hypothetical protein [Kitasatospora viridis]|uniref:Peptide zinc metalloprotease protein n=1 Tax=Kitasatospora viridis TaxID=281105 RepID=A0A561T6I2_9ACTN|nr:hypothetical protein [Kitasatospora viridis]TWF82731.1 hypothetical protein FHX73_14213 [Kitasatospora viridis]